MRVSVILIFLGMSLITPKSRPDEKAPARLHRPIALALDGKTLFVANRDSGTLAIIDAEKLSVVKEHPVGKQLSGLALTDRTLFVTDEEAGELIELERPSLKEISRFRTGVSPVSICVSGDAHVVVACLWPRRVIILPAGESVDLPFAPRVQLALPGTTKVIVADSFGGGLAVLDVAQKRVESTRFLPVNNIRGLALDPKRRTLLMAHQVLSPRGRTTSGEIQTSNLITNNVRRLSLAAVLDPLADLHREEQVYQLGGIDRGAGDPGEIYQTQTGEVVLTLSGVNELAIGRPEQVIWSLIPVGTRPTALAVDEVNQRAYVADTFSDSISVVDLKTKKVTGQLRLGADAKLTAEQRGEMHFFDARLSFESWFSCHSCHPDGHTNGRLNDNFSDGSFGTPKRVLSLLGSKDTGPYAWHGGVSDLETQVRNSVKSTMQSRGLPEEAVRDLTAYLRTLPPPPSITQARGTVDAEAIKRGRKIFSEQKCATCHPGPTYTSAKSYDVGLKDETGGSHFNPPSLRGVSQAGPYFHDGRAGSLKGVFTRFGHQLSRQLSKEEVADLVQFLSSL